MLKNKKNIIAIFLTMFLMLAGVVFLFPVQKAFAATTITTCEELQNMRNNLAEDYSLGNNIDCDVAPYNSGTGFEPIGDLINKFTGTFDGQTYKITGLYINRPATDYVGLFGFTDYATIENAHLEDVNITGHNDVGGLGGNIPHSFIDNCWSSGTVAGNFRIGGLAGRIYYSPINNSYSTCDISGVSYTGGLAGYAKYSSSSMTNCYFAGTVTASGSYVGAVAGRWRYSATANDCFYDNEITDKTDSYATGKTTAEMKQQATFTNWDFVDIWVINEGVTYPLFTLPSYISSAKDFTALVNFNTLSWSETIESGVTSISMYTRAGNVPVPDSSWTDWLAVSSSGGAIPDSCDNKQYLQYKAVLASSNPYKTPYLHDVTVSYYYSSDALTSSKYNSEEAANVVAGVKWTEDVTLPDNTEVAISVRSASSSGGFSDDWAKVASSTSSTLTTGCTKAEGSQEVICNDPDNPIIPANMRDEIDDQWIQYKISLTSTGANTPTVESFSLIYVVNAPPEFEASPTVSQGSDGLVGISYSVRDIDTAQDGAACPNCVTPSFEYSLNDGDDWDDITLGLSENATSTKAVEEVNYTTHSLTWNPKTMVDDNYSAIAKIRITVDDGEAANRTAIIDSSTFTIDTTDPAPVLVVDSKDDAANVLSLSVTEDTMEDLIMKLSNDSLLSADGQNADSGNWIAYATTKDWILSGDPETIYYQLKDKYGNVSADDSISSIAIPVQPSSIVYQDISNAETSEWREFVAWGKIAVPSLGFKRYNIYRSINGASYSLLTTKADININYVVDTDLITTNIYAYKVTAEDNSDNISNYSPIVSDAPNGQGGTDITAPTITSVISSNTTTQSATITWDTDELSNSTVEYITIIGGDFTSAPSQGVATMLDNASGLGQHSVILTGLVPNTTYYYQVKSVDPSSNSATSKQGDDGYTFSTLADNDAPAISGVIAANIADTTATIQWATDEGATGKVSYGTESGSYADSTAVNTDYDFSHAIDLSGLTATVRYYYQVTSADANGNSADSAEYDFTTSEASVQADTTAPVISAVEAEAEAQTAEVSWTTDESSNSFVEYGEDEDYGSYFGDKDLVTSHVAALEDLAPNTKYHYQVFSADSSGNLANSSDKTFKTSLITDEDELEEKVTETMDIVEESADEISNSVLESTLLAWQNPMEELAVSIPAPTISGALAVTATAKTATFKWTTNKKANSLVAIASDEEYNSKSKSPYQQVIGDSNEKTTGHSITAHSLEPDTEYHCQLRSKAAIGPTAKSSDSTFKTEKETLEISDHTVQNVSTEKAVFKWATNVEADSTVKYIPYRDNALSVDEARTESNETITTMHEITVDNFEAGVVYAVELISRDANDNVASEKLSAFSTAEDDLPPVIHQVQTDSALSPGKSAKVQAIISWITGEPATTRVYYQQGIVAGSAQKDKELAEKTKLDTNYTKKHVVVLTKFNPGSVYSFKAESVDSGGNTTLSKTYTILTPRQKESVFQVIMKNMEEIFGWVGKMR